VSTIEIVGLGIRFGDATVLHDLDLRVDSASITAILGSSGSGKSTLLRCIAGLLRPGAGSITIGTQEVVGPGAWVAPERRGIGLVPQEGALFPHLSVADNVGYGLRGSGKRRRVDQMLELVGLPGTGRMRPHELSGGMQQRVAVARALAPSPAVILLDEPFSALDAGLREDVREDVFAALRTARATAVLVTHDQEEAFAVADRVAVMMGGTVAQSADPVQVYTRPASLAVARFVGDTVVIPATGAGDGVQTEFGAMPASGPTPVGRRGVLVHRPEDFHLGGDGPVLAPAVVTGVRYHGHDTLITAVSADQQFQVRVLGRQAVVPGASVDLQVRRPGTFFVTD